MKLSILEISKITNATLIGSNILASNNWIIETDSRHVVYPERTIFIAIKGTHYNGIHFIHDLIKKGVLFFIIDQEIEFNPEVTFIKVNNCLKALQSIALAHREQFSLPIIGITGSNGKTIIKEWLSQLLAINFLVCKNPKSHNSQFGVALSILELNSNHEIGVFEAGISEVNEMQQLQNMIQPKFGIFTNLGDAHDAGFTSLEEKLKEKIKLFEHCQYFYYPGDQELLINSLINNSKAISWGYKSASKIPIDLKIISSNESIIHFNHKNNNYNFNLPFSDYASLENVIPCILMALDFNINKEDLQEALLRLHGIKLRLEQKEGINGCILINDSYSLDIKSLKLSFQFADKQNQNLERVLIISDFASAIAEEENFNDLVEFTKKYDFKKLIGIGPRIEKIQTKLNSNQKMYCYSTTDEFIKNLDQFIFKNQLILIKGARSFQLEKIFEELSLSNHESILEINLKSIAHNVSIYKSYLKPTTKIIAVVKASAYGSGNYEIAKYLEHLGVHWLAVAYQDEAIHLRNKGIQCPIMVMNSGLADFEELFDRNIEPAIFSLSQLKRIVDSIDANKECRIHIKLDTGMRRLGFMKDEMAALKTILEKAKNIKVISIFSHLSGSDSKQFDEFTKIQYIEFEEMYDCLTEKLTYKPLKHLLNSGGISRHPDYQFDLVRVGIGMYGIDSNPEISNKLIRVHRLKTRITQIKKVSATDKISYNQTGTLNQDGSIAILSIGYADGLPRNAGTNNYEVYIHGKKCPLIGVVCMDMCMVDITKLDQVQEGDEVEIFGSICPIELLAAKTNRIPYEILCGISTRVKRVFIEE